MPNDSVECPICGKSFRQLMGHLKIHSLSVEQFRNEYPLSPLSCADSHLLLRKKDRVSDVQKRLYDFLCRISENQVELEYRLGPCFIDIAIPERKIAIEVDGCFYHDGNGNSPIQKRCAKFDEIKNGILQRANWKLLRTSDEDLIFRPCETLKRFSESDMPELLSFISSNLTLFPEKTTKCIECGSDLTIRQFYSGRRFCNGKCKKSYESKHPSLPHCRNCGKEGITIKYRNRLFCSEECKQSYGESRARHIGICEYCGRKVYSFKDSIPHFCDNECMRKFSEKFPEKMFLLRSAYSRSCQYNVERRKSKRIEVKCGQCGKVFWTHLCRVSPLSAKKGLKFCSSKCYHLHSRKREIAL